MESGDHPSKFCDMSDDQSDLLSTATKIRPNEELDNFLGKVNEISDVINALASKNPAENERGLRKAEILLGTKAELGNVDNVECQVKHERTVINKVKDENPGEMCPNAWMRMMEKDSAERAANRKERKTKSDHFRDIGNAKFSKQDYAEAVRYYNEAIKLIKDSPCLYNNRALTHIRLGIYSSAIEDCEKTLRLDENNLRGRLFMAKAYYLMGEVEKCKEVLQEARETQPDNAEVINDYEAKILTTSEAKGSE